MNLERFDSRDDWLEARRRGVGASEAAVVLGISPFATPLKLYLRKIGVDDFESSPLMQWGTYLQPAIAEAYKDRTEKDLIDFEDTIIWSEKYPWLFASLDYGRAIDLSSSNDFDRVVEVKRVLYWAKDNWGDDGTDEIPTYYYSQVQQQLECSGKQIADVAALIGDCDFRIFTIERDDDYIEELAEAARLFMEQVANEDPPMPDFDHPTTLDLLNGQIEPNEASAIFLDDDALELAVEYSKLSKLKSTTESRLRAIKSRLIFALGDASFASLPRDSGSIKRTIVEKRGFYVEPSSYPKLTIKVED